MRDLEEEMLEFLSETSPNDGRHIITTHWLSRLRVWRQRAAGDEHPALYDIARDICHDLGMAWTDPRTGETCPPPQQQRRIG